MAAVGSQISELIRRSRQRLKISASLQDRSYSILCRTRDALTASKVLIKSAGIGTEITPLPVHPPPPELTAPATQPPQATPDLLQVLENLTIENQIVDMDGKHIIGCSLSGCQLRYGGQPVVVESTSFEGCTFSFNAEAALTLRFLECFGMLPLSSGAYDLKLSGALSSSRPN